MKMDAVDWKTCASRIPALLDRAELEPDALACLESLRTGQSVGIACSGGADSVLLTLVLVALVKPGLAWHVLHFDHGMRGKASAIDARFVAEMASGLDLPYRQETRSVEGHCGEAELREARLEFLHRTLTKLGSVTLASGHHADDVVETMLIRLARGSGSAGLAAPRPVQPLAAGIRHLRPLLRMRRERIREILDRAEVPWCEDATNRKAIYLRNRLRRDVIPSWVSAENRDLTTGVLLARRRLQEEDEALAVWLNELLPTDFCEFDEIDLKVLVGRPRALWRRAIESWARGRPGLSEVGRPWIESLIDAAMAGGSLRVSAGRGGRVEVEGARLCHRTDAQVPIVCGWPECTLALGSTLLLPDGASVTARAVDLDSEARDRVLRGEIDPASEAWIALGEPAMSTIRVRSRRAGDRYRPLGSPGTNKVGDQLTNRKIPMERRCRLPVFCLDEDELAWCPGLPPAHLLRINAETIHAVQLTYCWHPATFHL